MIEIANVDMWSVDADLHVITTNGMVKTNGACVMGRGCAKEARDMFPYLDMHLGHLILENGNHVHYLGKWADRWNIASFPVKVHWQDRADLGLIKQSLRELKELVDGDGCESVILPRPGCGNGQLSWEDVKPLLTSLDDRFIVVSL